MDRCRNYSVAEHVFGISAEESIFELLTNYAPFETTDTQSPLFHLNVNSGPLSESHQRKHIYTDSSDEDMPRIEVYRLTEPTETEQTAPWLFAISIYRDSEIVSQLVTSWDFREATLYVSTSDVRFAIDNAAMLLYAFTSASLATLEIHASVISYQGKAYVFLGKSGTGKSTHSRQWLARFADAELLNDDNPIIRLYGKTASAANTKGEVSVKVFGSPWSGKTPCYKAKSAPLQAIVALSQAPQNVIHTLRLPEAYAHMLSSSSGLKIVPTMMDALYETISTLVMTVPTFGLQCLPNIEAAEVCYHGTQGC